MSDTVSCAACGSANEAGRKFCGECGSALSSACPSCGTPNAPGVEVLRRVRHRSRQRRRHPPHQPPASTPAAERRLVSVLFADLVGFTTLSESRDSEDVRELLSRYFETSPAADRALRRNGREVHRRRGDGGLGYADRDRRRRRARCPRRTRSRSCGLRARRRGRSLRPTSAGRSAHRRSGGHARRRGAGHGRRRPREHRLAHAVGRRAGHGVRRRVDAARDRADDRLRGRRLASSSRARKGSRRSGGRNASLRPSAARSSRRASRRRSSAATASCDRSRISSTRSADEQQGAPRLGDGHRRHRQVAARMGVLQVLRRASPTPSTGTAGAASPTARASRTGRSRTWCACAAASPRRRNRASALLEAATPRSRSTSSTPRSGASSSPASRTCSGSRSTRPRDQRGPLRRLALFFERLAETLSDRARLRGHAVGGREPARLRRVPARLVAQLTRSSSLTLARPELLERRPTWGAGQRNFTSLYLEPLSRHGDGASFSPGSCPGLPDELATRSSRAPKASRSTRSRPCGCCSTAACSCRRAPCTGPTGEIESLEVPETLHALIAARLDGLPAGGATPAPGRRRPRQDLHASRRWLRSRARGGRARSAARRRSRARRCSACRPTPARPSTASTASCRTSFAMSPTRRSRSGAPRPAPRRRRSPRATPSRGRGRGRRGHRLALPRRVRGGAGRR